jgi:sulfite reductase alpha subunit-like flavoprotein
MQEKLLEYELSLQSQNHREKPEPPAPTYDLSFFTSKDDEDLSDIRRKLLADAGRSVFEVAANDVISAPHQTTDGAWRSVRHIDLLIRDDQQELVSEQASNIGVYVPNDLPVVERMLVHLHVDDPGVVYAAESLAESTADDQKQSSLQQQGLQQRPFAHVGTVSDALTWTFDLVSTPRPSFLRSLAAYATDEKDLAALMAPKTAEAIQAER